VYWHALNAWIWLAVEAEVAVICASAPALKSLFMHAKDKVTPRGDSEATGGSDSTITANGENMLEKMITNPNPTKMNSKATTSPDDMEFMSGTSHL
jgi:hypothetical protein